MKVDTPVTLKLSSTTTCPPAESSVRSPVEVSILLSSVIPIWILSIVAPPFASMAPVNVDTPVTDKSSPTITCPVDALSVRSPESVSIVPLAVTPI